MIDAKRLMSLEGMYGTPAYVFDLEAFRQRVHDVRAVLGGGVGLCFSVKANPFLVPAAANEGILLEVCSPGELEICMTYGVEPWQIVYSGVCKGTEDVRVALSYGVGTITAESPAQLALIDEEATKAGLRAPVLLRLAAKSQFGMTWDDLLACVDSRYGMRGVSLLGIHYFVGTQRPHSSQQRRDMELLEGLIGELRDEHGWDPGRVEYGPGLHYPYFDEDDFSDTLAPVRGLVPVISGLASGHAMTVEMGRFLASGCGCYMSRIVEAKNGADCQYAFVAGGINHVCYHGHMMGMKRPVIRNLSVEIEADQDSSEANRCRDTGPWNLYGSLCTTSDVLARGLGMPLAVGDLLSFEHAGAYSVTEGISLFLSRDLPKVVLLDSGRATLRRSALKTSHMNMPDFMRGWDEVRDPQGPDTAVDFPSDGSSLPTGRSVHHPAHLRVAKP